MDANMNHFYITAMIILFASYCSSQTELSNSSSTSNTDYENAIHCKAHICAHKIKYVWTIHNFSAHERLGKDILAPKLRALTTNKVEWELRLQNTKTGYYYDTKHILLHLFLSPASVADSVEAEYDISIINHKEEVLLHKHVESKRYTKYPMYDSQSQSICKKDDCFRNHLLQNDTLMMIIHLKWFFEPSYHVFRQRKALPTSPTIPTLTPDTITTKNKNGSNFFLKFCKNLHKQIF